MAELRYCARARKEAKGYDKVSITLIALLKLPIRAGETGAIVLRINGLLRLFLNTTPTEASRLYAALTDPSQPLGQFYSCELATKQRADLLQVLKAQSERIELKPSRRLRPTRPARPVVTTIVGLDGKSPLVDPRYIDNVAQTISVRIVLGDWVLIWRQNGREQVANIAPNQLIKGDVPTILWAREIYETEEQAQSEAYKIEQYNKAQGGSQPQVITFYKGHGKTIRPILYSPVTAPRMFEGMRIYIEDGHLQETVNAFVSHYTVLKDFVNPFFFDIDQNGEVSISGPPKLPNAPKLKIRGMKRIMRRLKPQSIEDVLRRVNAKLIFKSPLAKERVYLTDAGQIIGTYKALDKFRLSAQAAGKYKGWHRHHIIESRHLKDLGVKSLFPVHADLPSVLLPSIAHSNRIARDLTEFLGKGRKLTELDVFDAYAKAYRGLGDYNGGGAGAIQTELRRIVGTMLELD